MVRLLFFLLVVFALGLGFAWLADRPGDMVVTFDGYQYQVSLMAAATAVTALVGAILVVWWLLKSIWYSPYTISRYFRVRRRDRGYQALSTGIIAAGAGDIALARTKNREAAKLIRSDQEPLIHLLEAQSLLLEGDHTAARQKFEAMLDDPETKLLGLRGLYLEAQRLGEKEAARHYAARAVDIAPQLGWASDASIEEHVEQGDWDAALKLLDAQKTGLDRAALNRKRGVLLTAKAMALFETDAGASRTAALEANRLLPEFAPTAVIAARNLFRGDELRKGSKVLEAAWSAEPHPDIADLYMHARVGDATHDRLNRAQRLQSLRQNNVDSSLAVARGALDAGEFKLAREEAQAAIRMQPREAAYLLLADIEEAQSGDVGRVRQWLARAVRAPRDPAWIADGQVSRQWLPISPVSGRLDAFRWAAPVELGPELIEQEETVSLPASRRNAAQEEADDIVEAETIELPVTPVAANDVRPAEQAEKPAKEESVRLPDDPGVEEGAAKPARRFRLF